MSRISEPTVALVAEDEPLLRLDAADTLRDAGFLVFEAANADEALSCLEDEGTISLLLTDIRMPGRRDGLALAREVAERWPQVQVVVCSSGRRPTEADLPDGAVFIPRPCPPERFVASIADLQTRH